LADAQDSGSCPRKGVEVRLLSPALWKLFEKGDLKRHPFLVAIGKRARVLAAAMVMVQQLLCVRSTQFDRLT